MSPSSFSCSPHLLEVGGTAGFRRWLPCPQTCGAELERWVLQPTPKPAPTSPCPAPWHAGPLCLHTLRTPTPPHRCAALGAMSLAVTVGSKSAGQASLVMNITLLVLVVVSGMLVNPDTMPDW